MTVAMRSKKTTDRLRYDAAMRHLAALAAQNRTPFEVPRAEVRRRIVQDHQAPHRAASSLLSDWHTGKWSP